MQHKNFQQDAADHVEVTVSKLPRKTISPQILETMERSSSQKTVCREKRIEYSRYW